MISDIAQAHGSFFILLFDAIERPLSVEILPNFGNGSYILNDSLPIYLKHTTKLHEPWRFNFSCNHKKAQESLFNTYGKCFTCLICGRDGIVGMDMRELRQVLDNSFQEQEIISVRRALRTQYLVKGRDGTLERRVSRKAVFDKIRAALE